MSVSDEQITKLFKARRTLLQMLRDREYSVPDSDVNMTRQQFIEKFGENIHLKRDDLLILSKKGDAPTDQIYVFFPAEQKVGVPMVRNCAKRMKADSVYNAILVVQRALTAPAKAAIVEINSYFHMEVFEEAELLTNITEHMFVPKHTVLKDKEKKELVEKYRVKETQLPRILVSDPVAKYYGMRRGQVLKITRQSVTADTYDTYRYASANTSYCVWFNGMLQLQEQNFVALSHVYFPRRPDYDEVFNGLAFEYLSSMSFCTVGGY